MAGSTLKYVTTDHKRTAPKARIRGQRQRQPLEKWDANMLLCNQHKSREVCTLHRGGKLHSAAAGDEFPVHPYHGFIFTEATVISSLL